MKEHIHLKELELSAHLGVPAEERARPQRLTANITVELTLPFAEIQDDISRTVDYAKLAQGISEMVAAREDRLVETLAGAIAEHVLEEERVQHVRVELRKFVLPRTRHVAVIVERRRGD